MNSAPGLSTYERGNDLAKIGTAKRYRLGQRIRDNPLVKYTAEVVAAAMTHMGMIAQGLTPDEEAESVRIMNGELNRGMMTRKEARQSMNYATCVAGADVQKDQLLFINDAGEVVALDTTTRASAPSGNTGTR